MVAAICAIVVWNVVVLRESSRHRIACPSVPFQSVVDVPRGPAPWERLVRAAEQRRCRESSAEGIGCPANGSYTVPRLSKELVDSVVDAENYIFLSFTDAGFLDFARSWVANLARAGVHNLLIGAMKEDAAEGLHAMHVPHFLMTRPAGLSAGAEVSEYLSLGSFKTSLVAQIMAFGADVILSDLDNLILRDPRPFFRRYGMADVLSTADLLSTTSTNGGLERRLAAGVTMNVGLLLLRKTAKPLVDDWAAHMVTHPTHWDQAIFNDKAKRGWTAWAGDPTGQLHSCAGGRLRCGVLPIALFCGGHTFHAENLPHKLGVLPYAVHTTYVYGGTPGKRHRLREAMAWEDGPEYYAPASGVLSYQPDVPAWLYAPRRFAMKAPGALMDLDGHFALVNHQLRQLRNAMALANATARILVLPKLVCGLDRFFYRHDGVTPGSATNVPLFSCPADMVLDFARGVLTPERWIREFSFFDNPRTDPALHRERHEVALERVGNPPPGREEILGALRSPQAVAARAVHLVGELPDAEAWLIPAEYSSLEAMLRQWSDHWCCGPLERELNREQLRRVASHVELGLKTKSHVYYDMYFDKVPHTDKVGRTWTTPWRVIYGEKWNATESMSQPWRSMVETGPIQK